MAATSAHANFPNVFKWSRAEYLKIVHMKRWLLDEFLLAADTFCLDVGPRD